MISQKTLSTTCSRSCSQHETSSSNVRSLAHQLVAPVWEHCLDYEHNIRKEAIERTRKRGLPIQQALWSVYGDESHRMEHWVTLLCQANAAPVSAQSGEIAAVRKELAEMRRKLAQRGDRSRSPHRKSPPALMNSQNTPLAIRDRPNPKSKGKGKGQKNTNKRERARAQPAVQGHREDSRPSHRSGRARRLGTHMLHRTEKVQESVTGSRATSHVS